MPLNDTQKKLAGDNPHDFAGLKALFVNCTLKASHQGPSHTETLMRDSMELMELCGVEVDYLRAADRRIAFGVQPDMREHGAEIDDWPEIFWPKVKAAEILVIGTPLWLGEESSLCRMIIERLYAHSAQRNDRGQYVFYGKVGGTIVTGITSNGEADDRLIVRHEGTGAGQVNVVGSTIQIDGVQIATFSGGVGVGQGMLSCWSTCTWVLSVNPLAAAIASGAMR